MQIRKLVPALVVVVIAAGGYFGWRMISNRGPGAGFANGNGRIEATEIDIATKLPGRVKDVLVREGDFVSAGQTLPHLQVDTLQAQSREAQAQHQQAVNTDASAKAQIALRESDQRAAEAVVVQRQSELDAAKRRLARSEKLSKEGASSMQELDDDAVIVCICHHGMRSMSVAAFLERNGFTNVINLTGGVDAWAQQVDNSMPKY